ncbi:hypothetical protein PR048_030560 [Dryococelus australis]|uniref:Uncharacterized protein n=1 Tax=Dryococelus australis TaxID=614101 RepID=A0ABQ9G9B0_9NEOP|nr:hypothetical protein PR048_030560 [Dryococelus australis]
MEICRETCCKIKFACFANCSNIHTCPEQCSAHLLNDQIEMFNMQSFIAKGGLDFEVDMESQNFSTTNDAETVPSELLFPLFTSASGTESYATDKGQEISNRFAMSVGSMSAINFGESVPCLFSADLYGASLSTNPTPEVLAMQTSRFPSRHPMCRSDFKDVIMSTFTQFNCPRDLHPDAGANTREISDDQEGPRGRGEYKSDPADGETALVFSNEPSIETETSIAASPSQKLYYVEVMRRGETNSKLRPPPPHPQDDASQSSLNTIDSELQCQAVSSDFVIIGFSLMASHYGRKFKDAFTCQKIKLESRRRSANCLNIVILRANRGEVRWVWNGAGMQERKKRQILKKTRRPASSSDAIPTYENFGATPLRIEPGFDENWRFEMNFVSISSSALNSNGSTDFCVDLRSDLRSNLTCTAQRHDGNTGRLARRSDEALGVRVSVAPDSRAMYVLVSLHQSVVRKWVNGNLLPRPKLQPVAASPHPAPRAYVAPTQGHASQYRIPYRTGLCLSQSCRQSRRHSVGVSIYSMLMSYAQYRNGAAEYVCKNLAAPAVHTRRTQQEPVTRVEPGETGCIAATHERAARHPLHTCCAAKCTTTNSSGENVGNFDSDVGISISGDLATLGVGAISCRAGQASELRVCLTNGLRRLGLVFDAEKCRRERKKKVKPNFLDFVTDKTCVAPRRFCLGVQVLHSPGPAEDLTRPVARISFLSPEYCNHLRAVHGTLRNFFRKSRFKYTPVHDEEISELALPERGSSVVQNVLTLPAVHGKVSTLEINLRKKSLPMPTRILMGAPSGIRPAKSIAMDGLWCHILTSNKKLQDFRLGCFMTSTHSHATSEIDWHRYDLFHEVTVRWRRKLLPLHTSRPPVAQSVGAPPFHVWYERLWVRIPGKARALI